MGGRYHAVESELDLYNVVDHNAFLKAKLHKIMDNLGTMEREFVALRYGILDHDGEGVRSYQDLAQIYQKDAKTLWRLHRKIIVKLQQNLP